MTRPRSVLQQKTYSKANKCVNFFSKIEMSPLDVWKRISVLCGKDCFEALPTSRESTMAACKSAPGLVADIIKKTKQNIVINIKNKYTGATKLFMMTNRSSKNYLRGAL